MQLYGLDSAFENIGFIPFINLQWKRKYYEAGSFSVQIRADDYNPDMVYIIASDRPEVGKIEHMHTSDTLKGKFVQLEGFFLEKMLDNSVVYPQITLSGTPPQLAVNVVRTHPPDGLTLNVNLNQSGGESTEIEWFGEEVGRAIYQLLKTQEFSQRITLDFYSSQLNYSVWQGLNRTQAQSVNPFAIFSDSSPAVEEFKLTEDSSGYKNFAVIAYGDTESPQFLYVDRRKNGEFKRSIFIDYTGTNEEKNSMKQTALERLQQYEFVRNVQIKAIQNGLNYLTDYDLGDKCDIVNHRLKKSYESRIIGIDEVFKKNQHLVTITFGEKIPTNYSKLSRLAQNMRR